MGRDVWVPLTANPDWRWLLGRADSPWYERMRLFRQPTPGDWDDDARPARDRRRCIRRGADPSRDRGSMARALTSSDSGRESALSAGLTATALSAIAFPTLIAFNVAPSATFPQPGRGVRRLGLLPAAPRRSAASAFAWPRSRGALALLAAMALVFVLTLAASALAGVPWSLSPRRRERSSARSSSSPSARRPRAPGCRSKSFALSASAWSSPARPAASSA